MAVITNRIFATRLQRRLEGDWPSSVASKFTLRYILQFVNDGVAVFAKKSAEYNSQIDGVYYVNDSFDVLYKDIQTKVDSATQQKYIELPAIPAGIPSNRALKSLTPNSNPKNIQFKPISRTQASISHSLCQVPNKTFYYIEDSKLKFIGCNVLTTTKFNLVMTSSGGDLDDPLNLPADSMSELFEYCYNQLTRSMNTDLTNDSVPLDSNTTA